MQKTPKKAERFPLWQHPGGQWCKKHRGKFYYFGTDREAALKEYTRTWDDIKAGRRPKDNLRDPSTFTTLADVINHFLNAKRERVTTGELTFRQWSEYKTVGEKLVAIMGRNRSAADLQPDEFASVRKEAAKRLGPVALGNYIQRVRSIFKYAFEAKLIDVPIRFGPDFTKPPRRTVRLEKAKGGSRMIEAAAIRKLLKSAGSPLDAMILLAINCGFGQGDCAELPKSALARRGWIDFHRPKTASPRRCKLWPETIKALNRAIANRPAATNPDDDKLVFITRWGRPYVRFTEPKDGKAGCRIDGIIQEFGKLTAKVGIKTKGFYSLRHVFRTVADECLDPVAAGLIMGHVDESIAANYRALVGDDRLERVAGHVRKWLFGGKIRRTKRG